MKIVLITVLVILAGMAAFLAFLLIDTRDDLAARTDNLNTKISELSNLQNELNEMQSQLDKTTEEMNKTTSDLDVVNKELSATQTELDTVTREKNTLTDSINSLEEELNAASEEIDSLYNSLNKYQETFGEVYEDERPLVWLYDTEPPSWSFELPGTPTPERPVRLNNNTDAVNPTYEELLDFLLVDTTDDGRYLLDYYVCTNFAETVHNNAEEAGIRAAFVTILYETEPGHAINAFLTTDKGLVYIDCTGHNTKNKPRHMDSLVDNLKIGNTPEWTLLFDHNWLFTDEERTVTEIEIYW